MLQKEMKVRNYLIAEEGVHEKKSFSVIADFEGSEEQLMNVKVDDELPILPLRNMVLFPGIFMPVSIGRKSSLKLIRDAERRDTYIGVVCQKNAETETPLLDDLHSVGTIAKIIRTLEMPDQSTTVILQGLRRVNLQELVKLEPYLTGKVEALSDELPAKDDKEFQALVEAVKDLTVRYVKSSRHVSSGLGFRYQEHQ